MKFSTIKLFLSDLRTGWSFVRINLGADWKLFIITAAIVMISSVAILPLPFITRSIIDNAKSDNFDSVIFTLTFFALVAIVAERVVSYYHGVIIFKMYRSLLSKIRVDLLSHLLKIRYDPGPNGNPAEMTNKVFQYTEIATSIFFDKATNVFGNILAIFFFTCALSYLDSTITMSIFLFLPLYLKSTYYFGEKIRTSTSDYYDKLSKDRTFFFKANENFIFSKVSGIQYPSNLFLSRTKITNESANNMMKFRSLSFAISGGITALVPLFILVYSAYRISTGELTAGTFFAALSFSSALIANMKDLFFYLLEVHQGQAAITKINEIYNLQTEKPLSSNDAQLIRKITLEHVQYRYSHCDKEVHHNVNFTISRGEIVGIMGKSGSGKSTLALIISGIISPTYGRILIDDKEALAEEMQAISTVVQQEPIFYEDSIIENVRFGDQSISNTEILALFEKMYLNDSISINKQRYDETIFDGGRNLSGGEKKRLAIARSLLQMNKKQVIVFDEPTAGLDNSAIESVIEQIKLISRGKFAIILTHDEKILPIVDRLVRI